MATLEEREFLRRQNELDSIRQAKLRKDAPKGSSPGKYAPAKTETQDPGGRVSPGAARLKELETELKRQTEILALSVGSPDFDSSGLNAKISELGRQIAYEEALQKPKFGWK
jgi:hypothetical protein